MHRHPQGATRTSTLVPATTLFRSNEQRTDRQPVRKALRERDELRAHAELLEAEERAGTADASLHLVEAEQGPVLRGELGRGRDEAGRSEEHTSELQSLMRNSYAVFCLKKKIQQQTKNTPLEK